MFFGLKAIYFRDKLVVFPKRNMLLYHRLLYKKLSIKLCLISRALCKFPACYINKRNEIILAFLKYFENWSKSIYQHHKNINQI